MEGERQTEMSLIDLISDIETPATNPVIVPSLNREAINRSMDSIVNHFQQILRGGSTNNESNTGERKPSGAAILLKMILNEIEDKPGNTFPKPISGEPLQNEHRPRIMSTTTRRAPPPLPPNKPKSQIPIRRPIRGSVSLTNPIQAFEQNWKKLTTVSQVPESKNLRSCLKKTSSQSLGGSPCDEKVNDVKNNNVGSTDDQQFGVVKKNSVRFNDEVETKSVTKAIVPWKSISEVKVNNPYALTKRKESVPELNDDGTESVTTLKNALTSGMDFIDEFILSKLPQTPSISYVRSITQMIEKDY